MFRKDQKLSITPETTTHRSTLVDSACQALPTPTIITSSVTPPATSPTVPVKNRRDSTTQCGRKRRDSRAGASPERSVNRFSRLQRQVG